MSPHDPVGLPPTSPDSPPAAADADVAPPWRGTDTAAGRTWAGLVPVGLPVGAVGGARGGGIECAMGRGPGTLQVGPRRTICLSALGGDLSVLALRQIHIPHHVAAIELLVAEVVFDMYEIEEIRV